MTEPEPEPLEAPPRRYDPSLVWMPLLIVGLVSALFVFAIVPHMGRSRPALEARSAPDFALPVMHVAPGTKFHEGDRVRLSSLRGRVVVLDFWASWCAPCRAQVPTLERVAKRHPEVAFIGINTGDSPTQAAEFVTKYPFAYTSLHDEGGRTAAAYDVTALPTLIVINAQGAVHAVRAELIDDATLEALLVAR